MKKILVIEDNTEMRENLAEILELGHYEVLTAANGKEGAALALASLPDLIVCDIMMPVLDGYGVLHLLNQHPSTSGIPFIFLTAKSEKADLRKGMELGADDYLTKPFEGIDLLRAIEIRLRKADARQELLGSLAGAEAGGAPDKPATPLLSDERETYSFGRKQVVYEEGQRPKRVYYVLSGRVKTVKSNAEGKELITHMYGPGDFFGYAEIVEAVNYRESADVLEDAELMAIPRDEFLSLLSNDFDVARQFIGIASKNNLEAEEQLVNLAYNSLRRKVAFGLLQVYDKFRDGGRPGEIAELSRETLAQITGVAKESLIRTLSDFREEKLIELHTGGRITLLNEPKLRNLPY